MKTIARILAVAVAVTFLSSCGGSGGSSGNAARSSFKARTDLVLPEAATDPTFAWVQVGDTYGEYYKFKCDREFFQWLTSKLKLVGDALPSYPGSTLWGRTASEATPNDPIWWQLADRKSEQLIFHKEDYSTIAARSVMALWYDEKVGIAYMGIDFWD